MDLELKRKHDRLKERLGEFDTLAVAFSGGVDSTLLLAVAHDVLNDRVIAATGRSPAIPVREIKETRDFCSDRGIRHIIVDTHEFDIPGFNRNPPDRCYLCKKEILSRIISAAAEFGAEALAEGSNVDDDGDYRPGFKAVQELGVISPLRDAGFNKSDIRALARAHGLAVWNKPAFACLNSRFAYGDVLSPERLAQVDAAEEAVRALGFDQVRVRMQDSTARIEVPPCDIERIVAASVRETIVSELKSLGFSYVSLDMQGYRTGSMNETLG